MPNRTEHVELELEFSHAPGVRAINSRCILRECDGVCVAWVHGVPAATFDVDDITGQRAFIAQALVLGLAMPHELATAFSCETRTIHRVRAAYAAGGLAGLVPSKSGPKGARVGAQREQTIVELRGRGLTLSAIAERTHRSAHTVSNVLKRLAPALVNPPHAGPVQANLFDQAQAAEGGQAPIAQQISECGIAAAPVVNPTVPDESQLAEAAAAPAEAAPAEAGAAPAEAGVVPAEAGAVPAEGPVALPSLDRDPDDRALDRFLAKRGMLDDAAPLFKDRDNLAQAGVLLVVPMLVAAGVLAAGRESFGSIGPAFYGLRTSLMALFFMSFLRIKNAESLKLHAPPELGWLLGLDRAPEMKTVRRKLAKMGDDPVRTEAFLLRLLKRRVAARDEAVGYLYADGHVRVYSGKVALPKAHVARMRMALPATQELWINDADGSPLFFVTQEAHGQLVSELPAILEQVRKVIGPSRRITVVFDRGGWSPELFAKLVKAGFDVLTYRKGKTEALAETAFTRHAVPDGKPDEFYHLADIKITVGAAGFAMRQVTRLQPDGHQTHIVTTLLDLPAAEVARRMFARWQQENFFKYMRQEFAIDALVEHATEPDNPKREVPNPARKPIEKKLRIAKAELRKLEAAYGASAVDGALSATSLEADENTVKSSKTTEAIRTARTVVAGLAEQRTALPARVKLAQARPGAMRLAPSRKRLSDGLKMLAYQVETDLTRMVAPHYKRSADDGRKLIVAALKSAGDLELRAGELRVTLRPQSSRHRSRAVAQLCRQLDETETCFPGTSLRIRYAVAGFDVTEDEQR